MYKKRSFLVAPRRMFACLVESWAMVIRASVSRSAWNTGRVLFVITTPFKGGVAPTVVGFTLGYFQGVWIFILPLFLLFFGLGYFS